MDPVQIIGIGLVVVGGVGFAVSAGGPILKKIKLPSFSKPANLLDKSLELRAEFKEAGQPVQVSRMNEIIAQILELDEK